MKRVPTDREILEAIYDEYYETFASFSKESPDRETKIYVPVDLEKIADDLGVDKDIVFGRLYYHLDQKHGYKRESGINVHLFSRLVKNDRNCVNFPLMASVLASLQSEHLRFRLATTVSIISLVVAACALVVSVLNNFWVNKEAKSVKPPAVLSKPTMSTR